MIDLNITDYFGGAIAFFVVVAALRGNSLKITIGKNFIIEIGGRSSKNKTRAPPEDDLVVFQEQKIILS